LASSATDQPNVYVAEKMNFLSHKNKRLNCKFVKFYKFNKYRKKVIIINDQNDQEMPLR
jgi:hypothetical protein